MSIPFLSKNHQEPATIIVRGRLVSLYPMVFFGYSLTSWKQIHISDMRQRSCNNTWSWIYSLFYLIISFIGTHWLTAKKTCSKEYNIYFIFCNENKSSETQIHMFVKPLDSAGVTSILGPALVADSYANTSMLPFVETLASLSDIFLFCLSYFQPSR